MYIKKEKKKRKARTKGIAADLWPTDSRPQTTGNHWLTTWHWPLSPSGSPLHHLSNNTRCTMITSSPVKQHKVYTDHIITCQTAQGVLWSHHHLSNITRCTLITSSPVKQHKVSNDHIITCQTTQGVHWSLHHLSDNTRCTLIISSPVKQHKVYNDHFITCQTTQGVQWSNDNLSNNAKDGILSNCKGNKTYKTLNKTLRKKKKKDHKEQLESFRNRLL